MSKREELFSKFNIKNYNNELEDILENKSFSEGTKNILLNILYKMETAYDDFKKVKVYVNLKKELLEEIIEIIKVKCKEIEIVKPKINGDTKLKDKKYIIEKSGDKIISYPNEKNLFYALNHLNNKIITLDNRYTLLKEPIEKLINSGYIMDREELIRDFDGWTWNIVAQDIENYIYNLIYQNIRILLGNDFIQNCINNNKTLDFITAFETETNKILEENKESKIINDIYKIAILEDLRENEKNKDKLLKLKKEAEEEIDKMKNKKQFLQAVANSKKVISKQIKEIDENLSSNKLLRDSFKNKNKKLKKNEKIFSLSEFADNIQKERTELLKELEYYSDLMKPMNFVKKKEEVSKRYNILCDLDISNNYEDEISKLIISIQKHFLKLLNEKIKRIETKKEAIEYIYLFRYYKLIYINDKDQIKDIEGISKEIRITEKHLITKACKLKAINILSRDIEKNYKIISEILSYNIIELEDVNLEFKKHEKNIVATIFDDEIIEDSIIYDINEELNVKFNRKIKLFN